MPGSTFPIPRSRSRATSATPTASFRPAPTATRSTTRSAPRSRSSAGCRSAWRTSGSTGRAARRGTASPTTRWSARSASPSDTGHPRPDQGPRRQRRGPFFVPSAQIEVDRGDNPHPLVGRVGNAPAAAIAVARGDLEIALGRLLDTADPGVAVLGELLSSAARVARRFGHHLRLDVVELGEGVGHARTFLEQHAAADEVELPPHGPLGPLDVDRAQGHALAHGEDRATVLRVAGDVDPGRLQRIVGKAELLDKRPD